MSANSTDTPTTLEPATYLDMPVERRQSAIAISRMLSETLGHVALALPLTADVDDFRRVLVAAAPVQSKGGRS
jgi:hypothetical protein